MAIALVGIGTNLGDRDRNLRQAIQLLGQQPGIKIIRASRWIETRPVGGPPHQLNYLNGALLMETDLPPRWLLQIFHKIEKQMGRYRTQRWESRTIDLDLLLYDALVIEGEDLQVPHPRMAFRRFVLEPACEIAPDLIHPKIGWSLQRLLNHLELSPRYVAITGPPRVGKKSLVAEVDFGGSIGRLYDSRSNESEAFQCPESGCLNFAKAVEKELAIVQTRGQIVKRMLARGEHETGSACWLVSDFWLGQSLGYLNYWSSLGSVEVAAYEQARVTLLEAISRFPQPKLLVLLEDLAADGLGADCFKGVETTDKLRLSGASNRSLISLLREAIACEATRPGLGPVLRLTGVSKQECYRELAAAIQAME